MAPPKLSVVSETNFVPVTSRVKSEPPVATLESESDVMVGTGLLMVKLRELDEPVTATGTTFATGNVDVGTVMTSSVWVQDDGVSVTPSNDTSVDELKFVPVTVRVKAGSPTVTLVGVMDDTTESDEPPQPSRNMQSAVLRKASLLWLSIDPPRGKSKPDAGKCIPSDEL